MTKKQWIICGTCIHLEKCKSGKAKLVNVEYNSAAYNDIGCFDYEQINPKQIRLF